LPLSLKDVAVVIFLVVVFLWIFSVCLHEFAHAAVAFKGGDTSVVEKGYLTLNPMKYLDPMTSVLFPVLILIMGGIGLPGAAVYIETHRLKSAMWDSAVSFAGPMMNLLILIVTAILIKVLGLSGTAMGTALAFFAFLQGTAVILNLLPLPGFDGFGVIAPHLPAETRSAAYRAAPIVMIAFLLIALNIPGVFRFVSTGAIYMTHFTGIESSDVIQGMQAFRFWKN
jgi:Zn-dependent protease